MLSKYNFSHIYDLQNSSRTRFYKRYLFSIPQWSNSNNTIKKKKKKNDLKEESVLERFKNQLEHSNVKVKYCLKMTSSSYKKDAGAFKVLEFIL